MLRLKEYKANFHHHEIPDELAQLVAFQNSLGTLPFCRGFGLALDDRALMRPISEKREFLDALCPLGKANSANAVYAIWARDGEKQVGACPVLAFDGEGSVHVVTENLLQLMRLLTLDTEPLIDQESILFLKDESEAASPGATSYAEWLEKHLHQRPVVGAAEVELLVRSAQRLLEKPLHNWLKHFRT